MEGCGGLRFGHGALLRWADDGGGLGRGWRPNPGHPRSVRPGVRLFRPVLGAGCARRGVHRSRSGELMSRLSNDIDAVEDVVTDTVFGLARNVFTAAATLVLMLRFTWQL